MNRRKFLRFAGAVPAVALVPQFVRDFGAPFSPVTGGDLGDLIYNISPIDTPFIGMVHQYATEFGAVNVIPHQWSVDTL